MVTRCDVDVDFREGPGLLGQFSGSTFCRRDKAATTRFIRLLAAKLLDDQALLKGHFQPLET